MKNLDDFKRYKHFIICSHDAGGGNVLSSLVLRLGINERCSYILQGPSLSLYQKKIPGLKLIDVNNLSEFKANETLLLTSTSGASELERDLLVWARKNNVASVSVLDHWSNFKIRFVPVSLRENADAEFLKRLPDTIIVTDQKAYELAQDLNIPETTILLQITNPYLEDLKKDYHNVSQKIKKENRLLYMAEYFNGPEGSSLTELDYLERLLKEFKIYLETTKNSIEFYVRLHPSEDEHKYDLLKVEFPFLIIGNKDIDLLVDLAHAKVVIGKSSMGLIVSAQQGIPTYAYRHPQFDFTPIENGVKVIDKLDREILDQIT